MNLIPAEHGTFKSFDGTEIYYETKGEGDPLVFCYGLACQTNHWIHQVKHFSKSYRVILFDYRGHHRSETPRQNEQLTLDAMVKDLRALCLFLDLPQVPVFGHSLGVPLVLKTTAQHPELFSKLILCNGFIKNPLAGMDSEPAKKIIGFLKKTSEKHPKLAQKLWQTALLSPLSIPTSGLLGGFNLNLTAHQDMEVYWKGVSVIDFRVFIHLFDEIMNYNAAEDCKKIAQPALIFGGGKDGITKHEQQVEMQKLLKNSELVTLPYGSHCIQLDYPDFFNEKSQEFLNQG